MSSCQVREQLEVPVWLHVHGWVWLWPCVVIGCGCGHANVWQCGVAEGVNMHDWCGDPLEELSPQ